MAWLCNSLLVLKIIFSGVFALALEPTKAQATLAKQTLKIQDQKIQVEMAVTSSQQEQGLMFRESLKEGEGMLFVFRDESERAFWMKNTYIDLAIGYFDKNKVLVDIQEMKGTTVMQADYPNYPSAKPAQYALEVPKNWFMAHKIKVGAKFSLESSSSKK